MTILIILLSSTALVALFFWFRTQQEPVYISTKVTSTTKSARRPISLKPLNQKATRSIRQTMDYPKLARLMQGDREAARRLVQHLMAANPDRSEAWCYDKAVNDLMRDRH